MWETFIDQLMKTTWMEVIAMLCGLAFPILAAFEKKSAWIVGGISSLVYIWLMIEARLYQDAIINFYYVIMAILGYLTWSGVIKKKKNILHVSHLSVTGIILVILIGSSYALSTGYWFYTYTNASFPFIDSFVAGFAFIATWLESRKKIEHWILFFFIDLVCIWLFWQKGLILTSMLNLIYCFICVFGFIAWRKKLPVHA